MLSFAVSMVRVFLTHTDFFGVPKPTQVPEGARDSSNSDYWALPQVRTGDMIYSEEIQASETSPSSTSLLIILIIKTICGALTLGQVLGKALYNYFI